MRKETLIFEQVYEASPERVWLALTDKSSMKEWYFDIPDFEMKKGLIFNFYEPGNKKMYHHRCEIIDIIPVRKLQHTWTYPEKSVGKSIVTWELLSMGDKTKVKLTHEGVETFADGGPDLKIENYKTGWNELLMNNLRKFLK